MISPKESIICIDCGGPCHLLSHAPEDGVWEVDDVVSYRCRDCRDVWYFPLTDDDTDDDEPDN